MAREGMCRLSEKLKGEGGRLMSVFFSLRFLSSKLLTNYF